MRILLVPLLLLPVSCRAQRPEDAVLAVYKQMERAEQAGDADAWVSLWSRAVAPDAEKMRPVLRPQPDLHYSASRVYVQGDRAALLGSWGPEKFLTMIFIREDGRWKIKERGFRNTAPDPAMVYGMLPPENGAFMHAGSPWPSVALALNGGEATKRGWQMRTVHDDSFLYIRLESADPLPAPGSEVSAEAVARIDSGVHAGWPVMRINVSGPTQGEYVMNAGAHIADKATFDESGKANSHFHFVLYSMKVEKNGWEICSGGAGVLHLDPLISVADRFFDIRIPLRALGIAEPSQARIVVGDATWPKSLTVSVEAKAYH
jgi:hypothetical protein